MRRCAVLGCIVAAMTLCSVQPVAAQGAEISGGYSFLSNDSLAVNSSSLPFGFFFGAARHFTDNLSIVFDLNGHYMRGGTPSASTEFVVGPLPSEDFQGFSFNRPEDQWCSPRITACEVHTQAVSMVAGPRFYFGTAAARPFVHILGGLTRSLRKIVFSSHTSTNLTFQPGVGIDVGAGSTAFRIQFDYRRVFFGTTDQTDPGASLVSKDGADYQDFTIAFGVVYRVGG